MKFLMLSFILLTGCQAQNNSPVKEEVPKATEFKPVSVKGVRKLHGQQLYIPIYSSLYQKDEKDLINLTGVLSLRNTSFKNTITFTKVDYYDTNGKLIKQFIDQPFALGKMYTKDFVIPERSLNGGTGANFIVEWESDKFVSIPLVEAIMLGTQGTKGFAFSSRSQEIEAH